MTRKTRTQIDPTSLIVEQVQLTVLKPHPKNARHGDIEEIKKSLEAHGQYRPLVVQKSTKHVLAGNHTLQAARELGWESLAVTFVDVSNDQALRILLIDNRTNDLATYDDQALVDVLSELKGSATGLEWTGFATNDLDDLITALADKGNPYASPVVDDDIPDLPTKARTKPGQMWQLGPHRLLCGDSRSAKDVARLTGKDLINIAITSPPYAEQRKYDDTTEFRPIPPDQYVEWFKPIAANVAKHLAPDGSWFVNIKPSAAELDTELYVFDLVLTHAREWGWHYATEFCWERGGVPKSVTRRFKNQFEPIYQFSRGDWKMRPDAVRHASDSVPQPRGKGAGNTSWSGEGGNGGAIGKQGHRRQTKHNLSLDPSEVLHANLHDRDRGYTGNMAGIQGGLDNPHIGEMIAAGLAYPGNRLPTFAGTHEAMGHPAAFPVGLPAFFITAYTDAGDVAYDPFMGSGSTLMAAELTGRVALGIEISPRYCDVIITRWQNATGKKATLIK